MWVLDWIGVAQDRDRWWMIVSAVMNLWVPLLQYLSNYERTYAYFSTGQ
jgi:hypothetical protein